MAIEITIPRLGWSMDEGVFGEWLKADGEFVEAGEPVFTLESDKALQEVESVDGGFLSINPNGPVEGDTVTVGTLIGYLLEEGEEAPQRLPGYKAEAAQPELAGVASAGDDSALAGAGPATIRERRSKEGPSISPRAARLAAQLKVDWTRLEGSGRTGRIRECDVRMAAGNGEQTAQTPQQKPLGTIRRVIADRLMATVQNTAPVTLTSRADATSLVALREQFRASQSVPVPAYHDIIAKLVAGVLKRHPEMNSQWTEQGIIDPGGIHIGLAVDTDAGLLVPVIRDADRLSLKELAAESSRLIEKARQRTCTAQELSGGTFSITSLGSFGVDTFTPILNSPQTSILGLGAIRREAVVLDDDQIVARDQLPLSLTFDHRVVDGAPAAQFLQTLTAAIENPGAFLIA